VEFDGGERMMCEGIVALQPEVDGVTGGRCR